MVSPFASKVSRCLMNPTIDHGWFPSERLGVRSMPVRLCLISDYPVISQTPAAGDLQTVHRCAVALIQQGHQVYWLLSTAHVRALHNAASLVSVATDILPSTCQYVVSA